MTAKRTILAVAEITRDEYNEAHAESHVLVGFDAPGGRTYWAKVETEAAPGQIAVQLQQRAAAAADEARLARDAERSANLRADEAERELLKRGRYSKSGDTARGDLERKVAAQDVAIARLRAEREAAEHAAARSDAARAKAERECERHRRERAGSTSDVSSEDAEGGEQHQPSIASPAVTAESEAAPAPAPDGPACLLVAAAGKIDQALDDDVPPDAWSRLVEARGLINAALARLGQPRPPRRDRFELARLAAEHTIGGAP